MTSERSDHVISVELLPGGENASGFDGHEHGASVSFFLGCNPPGSGPGLHRHPYEETFIVQGGSARSPSARRRSRRPWETSSSFPPGRRTSSLVAVPDGSSRSASTRPPGWLRSGWSDEKHRPGGGLRVRM